MSTCKICGNTENHREYLAREMMFGTREAFPYFQCQSCGCLQIHRIPDDMSRHYPDGYYSFSGRMPKPSRAIRHGVRTWKRRTGSKPSDRILDVGSGQGRIVHEFARTGSASVTGIDPFLPEDRAYDNGARILKRELAAMRGEFDLIMMHHSFEHMPEPLTALRQARALLAPGKYLIVRIPVVPSFAWGKYATSWVSLDAPRHFYLHSRKSMEWLAERSGFTVESVASDSTCFQFWGSEQYLRGIPLFAPESYAVNRAAAPFSWLRIKWFELLSWILNRLGRGDQACFYLRAV